MAGDAHDAQDAHGPQDAHGGHGAQDHHDDTAAGDRGRQPSPWEWTGPGAQQPPGPPQRPNPYADSGLPPQPQPGPYGQPPAPPNQPPVMLATPPPPPGPPPGPPNPAQAAAVALLNLTGLGLGYVLLRQWVPAAVCWAVTIALLVVALPADPDGVPLGVVVGYAVLLLAFAADGYRRGLRAAPAALEAPGRRKLVLPVALALVLAVPGGGTLAYAAARDEAIEQQLLDTLAAADGLVKRSEGQSFTSVEVTYDSVLATYRDIAKDHPGSRAAKQVPDRLVAYYASVSAPYAKKDYCAAVPGLKHLRALPDKIDRGLLGDLAGKADEPLAESLFQCGTTTIGAAGAETSATEQLNLLIKTFPQSPYTQKIEPNLREGLRTREKALGIAPCDGLIELGRFRNGVTALPAETYGALVADIKRVFQRGDFGCGLDRFKKKEFSEAATAMTDYAKTYPDSPQTAQARSIAIAAEIAEETPAAGNKVPTGATVDGSGQVMVISNDGPGEVELLYTGPVTGRLTIPSCGSCKSYPTLLLPVGEKVKPCSGPSSKYPKRTLMLPPGNYQMLQKRAGTGTSAGMKKPSDAKIESGYSYTNCLYVTSGF
ncbi:hypothetical protein [Streptomyces sp. NPDC048659]|uniref:hypothetical protein n=1 Tax=Streptomyces sp. NPDC048659 TaxID=3155489 RepID=UPI00342970CF